MPGISITTTDQAVAQQECGRVYFPHRMAVLHDPHAFTASLTAVARPSEWATTPATCRP